MIGRILGTLIGLAAIGVGAYALTLGVTGQADGAPYPNSQHISTTPTPKGNR